MRCPVTPTFDRTVKKLHRQQKLDLDAAIQTIAADTAAGEAKVGDWAGMQVYKFKTTGQVCLLAYRALDTQTIKWLMAGPHDGF